MKLIVKNIKLNNEMLDRLSTNVTLERTIPVVYKNWHHKMYQRFGSSMNDPELRKIAIANREGTQKLEDEKKRILGIGKYKRKLY